jgi:hypothetical protein
MAGVKRIRRIRAVAGYRLKQGHIHYIDEPYILLYFALLCSGIDQIFHKLITPMSQ